MIITVTMNPSIDKTVDLHELKLGELNRTANVIKDAGGKGINVSKTICELGGTSLATGFLGGNNGTYIRQVLKKLNIQEAFIEIPEETRINTKIVENSGRVTELNEMGPEIERDRIDELKHKLEEILVKDDLLVLSGSIPKGVDSSIYRTLTEIAHKKGGKVFVDADGELFAKALEGKPDIVKPNRTELERYMGKSLGSQEEILDAGAKLLRNGVKNVIISLGAEGAYFLSESHTLYSPGLSVKTHSTVGAGDAMAAAFSYGVHQGYEMEECARLAMAVSAGAVMTVGTKPPTKELVEGLISQINMIKIV